MATLILSHLQVPNGTETDCSWSCERENVPRLTVPLRK